MAIEVSVVIPCFDAEATIGPCIDSVLAQSFEDFEILVVDDGSADATVARLSDYDDSRIRIIKLGANSGSPAVPRNVGIREAQGAWIAFLDADDLWHPQKLEKQIRFMKKNGYRFTCTDYIVRTADGTEHVRQARVKATLSDLLRLNTVGCSSVLIAKELIRYFEFRDRPQEDFDLWLQILGQQEHVYGLNEALTVYVKRKNSRSRVSFRNVAGFHALFKEHGQVGDIGAAVMVMRYVLKRVALNLPHILLL